MIERLEVLPRNAFRPLLQANPDGLTWHNQIHYRIMNIFATFLFLSWHIARLADTQLATVTIEGQPGYTSLRDCAQHCLGGFLLGDNLQGQLNCPNPLLESCYCRTDLASVATTFLSSCASNSCVVEQSSTTGCIGSVPGVYSSYCLQKRLYNTRSRSSSYGYYPHPQIRMLLP